MSNCDFLSLDVSGRSIVAAYNDFEGKALNLPSWESFHSRLTATNQFIFRGFEYPYGIIIKVDNQKNFYLISFRGTVNYSDAYHDMWSLKSVLFEPFDSNANFPDNVYVGSGFWATYVTKGPGNTPSLRDQLFAFIDNNDVHALYISGHSLGATTANLFALDLAVSRPNRVANVYINTFGSPMVGDKAWQGAYEKKFDVGKTSRVWNVYDPIVSLPNAVNPIYKFEHVGNPCVLNFSRKSFATSHRSCHNMENYQTICVNSVANGQSLWTGDFPDYVNPSEEMESRSVPNDRSDIPNWTELFEKHGIDLLDDPDCS